MPFFVLVVRNTAIFNTYAQKIFITNNYFTKFLPSLAFKGKSCCFLFFILLLKTENVTYLVNFQIQKYRIHTFLDFCNKTFERYHLRQNLKLIAGNVSQLEFEQIFENGRLIVKKYQLKSPILCIILLLEITTTVNIT